MFFPYMWLAKASRLISVIENIVNQEIICTLMNSKRWIISSGQFWNSGIISQFLWKCVFPSVFDIFLHFHNLKIILILRLEINLFHNIHQVHVWKTVQIYCKFYAWFQWMAWMCIKCFSFSVLFSFGNLFN